VLAEALTTHASALARLRHSVKARAAFERAISVAEQAGDTQRAGLAALALVEELSGDLTNDELCIMTDRAKSFLAESRDIATVRRLAINTCKVLSVVRKHLELPQSVDWATFSFPDAVRHYEAHFIKLALQDARGKITRAARLLRLKGHQALTALLKKHPDISVTRRKRSIIRAGDTDLRRQIESDDRNVTVLHVEDDKTVAATVKDMLEEIPGWQVETCADADAALEKISGEANYDLLLLDYDLAAGVNGLEIVRRAKKIAHRARTPIVVLSATPVAAEAREAGADVFLHKPQGVSLLVETITRLLHEHEQDA